MSGPKSCYGVAEKLGSASTMGSGGTHQPLEHMEPLPAARGGELKPEESSRKEERGRIFPSTCLLRKNPRNRSESK